MTYRINEDARMFVENSDDMYVRGDPLYTEVTVRSSMLNTLAREGDVIRLNGEVRGLYAIANIGERRTRLRLLVFAS